MWHWCGPYPPKPLLSILNSFLGYACRFDGPFLAETYTIERRGVASSRFTATFLWRPHKGRMLHCHSNVSIRPRQTGESSVVKKKITEYPPLWWPKEIPVLDWHHGLLHSLLQPRVDGFCLFAEPRNLGIVPLSDSQDGRKSNSMKNHQLTMNWTCLLKFVGGTWKREPHKTGNQRWWFAWPEVSRRLSSRLVTLDFLPPEKDSSPSKVWWGVRATPIEDYRSASTACKPVCIYPCMSMYIYIYIQLCARAGIETPTHADIHAWMQAYIRTHTCPHAGIHAIMPADMRTSMHTCIDTSIVTYIDT